jgi:hypothetical protein
MAGVRFYRTTATQSRHTNVSQSRKTAPKAAAQSGRSQQLLMLLVERQTGDDE